MTEISHGLCMQSPLENHHAAGSFQVFYRHFHTSSEEQVGKLVFARFLVCSYTVHSAYALCLTCSNFAAANCLPWIGNAQLLLSRLLDVITVPAADSGFRSTRNYAGDSDRPDHGHGHEGSLWADCQATGTKALSCIVGDSMRPYDAAASCIHGIRLMAQDDLGVQRGCSDMRLRCMPSSRVWCLQGAFQLGAFSPSREERRSEDCAPSDGQASSVLSAEHRLLAIQVSILAAS